MIEPTTQDELRREINRVVAAQEALQHTPVEDIVAAIDGVAAILADPQSAEGAAARAQLPEITGYSRETIEEILQHMCADWSAASLRALLQSELSDARILDAPFGGVFARGPNLTLHIFSGNVPGVAVTSLVRALLVKSPSIGKVAAAEPVLPALFVDALRRVAPSLARAVAIVYWKGGDEKIERIAIDAADAIVVYGGEDAVTQVAARAGPNKRLLLHGPKISFGVAGPGIEPADAREIARAVATYDQQGCVSPHVLFTLGEGRPLAEAIANELGALAAVLPRRRLDAAEALVIRDVRTKAEFREISGEDVAIYASEDTSFTVIYDATPSFTPSCLNRTLHVHPIESTHHLGEIIGPYREVLQSAAIAGFDDPAEITQLLFRKGVTRVTSFPELPWPPMNWFHDGRGPLNELLTYCRTEI